MPPQRACLWTNRSSRGSQAQEAGVLWKRCVGKDCSAGDRDREWVPGSHSHENKGEQRAWMQR